MDAAMEWLHFAADIVLRADVIYPTLLGMVFLAILFVFQAKFGVVRAVPSASLAIAAVVAPWVVKHPQPYFLSCTYWETMEPYVVVGTAIVIFFLINLSISRMFKFDRRIIHEIGMEAAKLSTRQEKFDHVFKRMQEAYPGKTVNYQEWVYYSSGGARGAMCILYASMFEYVMINGASIPFIGHTGRNPVNYSDTVLDGDAWYFDQERPYERAEYKTGEYCFAPEWEAYGTAVTDHCWFLEYARGFIPYLLPFGVADTFFSTLDFTNLIRMQWLYTKHNIRAMFH